MKTKFQFTIKNVMSVLIIGSSLTFASCGDRQVKTAGEKSNPEPPETDLLTATFLGDLETIRKHIEYGSDLNPVDPAGGSTPLITAVVFGKDNAARLLIEGGADLNMVNNEGSTALYCAAFFGRRELVKLLLDSGADKEIRNNYGTTALESVVIPFDDIKAIYDQVSRELGPLGFKLDYEKLESQRPLIAEMLR